MDRGRAGSRYSGARGRTGDEGDALRLDDRNLRGWRRGRVRGRGLLSDEFEPAVEAELDRIHEAPPEEFTAARNALAAELKGRGDREAATRVRALRKPSRPAWLINRIALKHPRRLDELVDAADRLRRLDAGDPAALREAAAVERDAVDGLVDLAAKELGAAPAGAVLDRVRETLQAVAADPGVRTRAQAGRLVREQRVATLGGSALATRAPERSTRGRRPKGKRDREGELRRARTEVKRLRKRAGADRERERRALAALERAEARAESARAAYERAEAKAAGAREALDAARSRLARAETELSEGERQVGELERG